jgi:hypothetical protein
MSVVGVLALVHLAVLDRFRTDGHQVVRVARQANISILMAQVFVMVAAADHIQPEGPQVAPLVLPAPILRVGQVAVRLVLPESIPLQGLQVVLVVLRVSTAVVTAQVRVTIAQLENIQEEEPQVALIVPRVTTLLLMALVGVEGVLLDTILHQGHRVVPFVLPELTQEAQLPVAPTAPRASMQILPVLFIVGLAVLENIRLVEPQVVPLVLWVNMSVVQAQGLVHRALVAGIQQERGPRIVPPVHQGNTQLEQHRVAPIVLLDFTSITTMQLLVILVPRDPFRRVEPRVVLYVLWVNIIVLMLLVLA